MSWSLNIIDQYKGGVEQQFYTPDCEIRDYLVYDPLLTAVISLEVTSAGLGATEGGPSIGQEVQGGGLAAGEPHSSRDSPPRCSALLAPREGVCCWSAVI